MVKLHQLPTRSQALRLDERDLFLRGSAEADGHVIIGGDGSIAEHLLLSKILELTGHQILMVVGSADGLEYVTDYPWGEYVRRREQLDQHELMQAN